MSESAVVTVWSWSIVGFAVVIVVVAVLLLLIRSTAAQIDDGAAQIWTQGKLVASNTIQIPLLLGVTSRAVTTIRGVVEQVAGATTAIQQHAESCPGCPDCVLAKGGD